MTRAPVALKCDPEAFLAVWIGVKRFEVRRDDRKFRVGDVLRLQEHQRQDTPGGGVYSGASIDALVTFKLPGGRYGLPDDLCVLGIEVIGRRPAS